MNVWFEPVPLWNRVQAALRDDPRRALLQIAGLALLGAAGMAAAMFIGTHYFSVAWNADLGFLPSAAERFDPFRTTLIGFGLAPLALGGMYVLILPLYRQPRRPLAAFAVAVVGALPIYVVGLLLFALPAVLLLFGAFILSCFWWSTGVRQLLGVGEREATEFNVLALLGSGVLLQFAGALLSSVL